MKLKIVICTLGAICLAMVSFRIWYSVTASLQIPLVAILCSSDPDVPHTLDGLLQHQGFSTNSDYRFTLYPCESPNTPRQAATMAVGSDAKFLVVMGPAGVAAATTTNIPMVDASKESSHQIATQIGQWLKNRSVRSSIR